MSSTKPLRSNQPVPEKVEVPQDDISRQIFGDEGLAEFNDVLKMLNDIMNI